MIINELYTIIVSILKANGKLDWPWSAILIPELIWLVVYLFTALFIFVAVRTAKDEPLTKEEWKLRGGSWDL